MVKFFKGERRDNTFKILQNRRCSWTGHIFRHNEFAVNSIVGAIFGKTLGIAGLQYLKQVGRNTAADSYTAMQRMAGSSSDGKLPTTRPADQYPTSDATLPVPS